MTDRIVWLAGQFISASLARVSPLDRGLLYGDGLFETLRAESGRVLRLDRHLARLGGSLAALQIPLRSPAIREWPLIINALLLKNDLARVTASVKIVVTRGEAAGHGLPAPSEPTVLVLADAYAPPAAAYREGWRLHAHAADGAGGMGGHKALAYLRLLAARQAALDAGTDEALLVDAAGQCVETAAGSLLALVDDAWVRVKHTAQLPGITVGAVAELLAARGARVVERGLSLAELRGARAAWVTGSLAGIVPVRAVDGAELPGLQETLAEELRGELFGLLDRHAPDV